MSLHALASVLLMAPQEDGAMPGEGLTAIETFTIFVAIPVGLFAVIVLISYALTAERKKSSASKSAITSID
ncbi:MAG: hypothetical protein RLZZ73_969 [Actinomycetota bacterium]|jgi:Tfp pilus assembly protein PilE